MKTIGWILLLAVAMAVIGGEVLAQAPAPPGAEAIPLRSPDELDQLLGPIALYPDPLIAEILPAATQPTEISLADRYVSEGGDVDQIDLQPWDPSVQGLARYPGVLRWMDENLAWSGQVGQAFLYQQADVMSAIQRLRAQALALGNLQSTPQQTVLNENGIIEIVPANPAVVYVPAYQPDLVYVDPPPQPGAFISFGIGLSVGAWFNHDFDWRRHEVIVWNHDHPRPSDWWRLGPGRRPPEATSSHVTVWRPRSGSAFSDRERENRGWGTEVIRAGPGARPALPPTPRPMGRVEDRRAPERPVAQPRDVGRPSPELRAPPARPVTPPKAAARPAPALRTPAARPEVVSPSRSSTGALIGVHSTPETHQYSVRGQQSRQTIAPRPAPAPARPPPASSRPSSAPAPSGEKKR